MNKSVWSNAICGISNFIKSGLLAKVYKYHTKCVKHFDNILREDSRYKIIL